MKEGKLEHPQKHTTKIHKISITLIPNKLLIFCEMKEIPVLPGKKIQKYFYTLPLYDYHN